MTPLARHSQGAQLSRSSLHADTTQRIKRWQSTEWREGRCPVQKVIPLRRQNTDGCPS